MNFFRFARARVIAWYVSGFITAAFGLAWLLLVVPIFTGKNGNGDHNGIGLLIGVVLGFIIFVKTAVAICNWFDRMDAETGRRERDRLRAEEDEWRRTHP